MSEQSIETIKWLQNVTKTKLLLKSTKSSPIDMILTFTLTRQSALLTLLRVRGPIKSFRAQAHLSCTMVLLAGGHQTRL